MKNQIRHYISVFVVAGTVSFMADPALAEVIIYDFTGTTSVGEPVTGSIAYDTSLPPAYDTGSVAGYIQPPPNGMAIVIGDATVQSVGNASLQMLNNSFNVDNFNGYFTQISVNGVPQQSASLSFYLGDSTQTVFSNTALPECLDVDSFDISNGSFFAANIFASFSIDTLEKPAIPVTIDIKPGGFPNSINPNNQGKIPVAILTTDPSDDVTTFDANTVDPATVLFGLTCTGAASVNDAWEDVDGDGDIDMILHFNTQDTGINCGDTSAALTGATFDGQAVKGTGSIRTVGCK